MKKKSKRKPANKHTVNRGTLAALLGVTASRVSQFVKQGMPAVRSGTRGRPAAYDPSKCVSWLLAREREKVQALEVENGTEDRELKRWRIAKLKQEWEREASFVPQIAGESRKVEFLLYKDDEAEPCLEPLRLWLSVSGARNRDSSPPAWLPYPERPNP